jgi:iron uptake system EfeUOB component EfeO/EfeM
MIMRAAAQIATVMTVAGVAVSGCGGSSAGSSATVAEDKAKVEWIAVESSACAPGWLAPSGGRYVFTILDNASGTASVSLEQALSGVVVAGLPATSAHSHQSLVAELQPGGAYRWSCTVAGATRYSAAVQIPSAGGGTTVQTPPPPATVDLIRPLGQYTVYVERLLPVLRAQLTTLRAQIAAGSLAGAKRAWLSAHLTWLELGQDDQAYGAFGNLGGEIDSTAAGKIGGSASSHFTGFHKVELDLWQRGDVTAAARDTATLIGLVDQLTPATVGADLPATTLGIDSWVLRCHEILEDALRDSLSAEDDYGSHTDLAALTADVSATREMLAVLAPLLAPRVPELVPTARRELSAIDQAIAAIHPGMALPWSAIAALAPRARERLDAAVDAALETLAPVSELMQVGNT